MLFNSYGFIFIYLPAVFAGFFFLASRSHRLAALWLVAASIFFYGWWNPRYLPIIIGSVLFNYLCGAAIAGAVSLAQAQPACSRRRGGKIREPSSRSGP